MDAFIGTILQVGFSFAPTNWAICAGQTIAISQNSALFALLGTTFGGNGTTTFCLPDLQGRVSVGTGNGAGLPSYAWGQKAGSPTVSILTSNLPPHNHPAQFTETSNNITVSVAANSTAASGTSDVPAAGNWLASPPPAGATHVKIYGPAPSNGGPSAALGGVTVGGTISGNVTVGLTGSGLPLQIEPPYLALTTIIALYGIFPSRN